MTDEDRDRMDERLPKLTRQDVVDKWARKARDDMGLTERSRRIYRNDALSVQERAYIASFCGDTSWSFKLKGQQTGQLHAEADPAHGDVVARDVTEPGATVPKKQTTRQDRAEKLAKGDVSGSIRTALAEMDLKQQKRQQAQVEGSSVAEAADAVHDRGNDAYRQVSNEWAAFFNERPRYQQPEADEEGGEAA